MLRDYLAKVHDKSELASTEQQIYRRLLTHVESQRERLHRKGLHALHGLYRSGAKTFTARMAKRWRRWHNG